ncbi:hypothetical protein KDM41_17770, partial [bacterium]|nr:hypothetical protein [bacterium]
RVAAGEALLEGLWWSEDDVPTPLAEDMARAAVRAALATLPPDGPADGGPRGTARIDFAMGHVMPALRGRVSGRRARAWIEEELP